MDIRMCSLITLHSSRVLTGDNRIQHFKKNSHSHSVAQFQGWAEEDNWLVENSVLKYFVTIFNSHISENQSDKVSNDSPF